MTKLEQAARELLDALWCKSLRVIAQKETALREALAEQAEQECKDCTRSHPHEEMSKCCELRTEIARLRHSLRVKELAEQAECKECGAKQAQIDRLMLEYCPDEMTPEQMLEWGNNQRPAEQAEQKPVAIAIVTKTKTDANYITNIDLSIAEAGYKLSSGEHSLYAAPVRTKDLTNSEKLYILGSHIDPITKDVMGLSLIDAAIAADREKNK